MDLDDLDEAILGHQALMETRKSSMESMELRYFLLLGDLGTLGSASGCSTRVKAYRGLARDPSDAKVIYAKNFRLNSSRAWLERHYFSTFSLLYIMLHYFT